MSCVQIVPVMEVQALLVFSKHEMLQLGWLHHGSNGLNLLKRVFFYRGT